MSYYVEPDSHGRDKINIELDLFNQPTKSDVKEAAGVDTLDFAEKTDLTSLKSDMLTNYMQINWEMYLLI